MDESHVLILFAVVAIVIGCFFTHTMNVIESIHNDREQKILQIIDIIDMTNTTQFEKIVLIDSMCGENTICRNTLYKKYIIGN